MAVLQIGYTWPSAGQFTSTNMNNSVNLASFTEDAADGSTLTLTGTKLAVKDLGITAGKLAASAVTPAKIDRDGGEFFLDDVTASTTKLTPGEVTQSTNQMFLDLDDGNFQVVTLSANVTSVDELDNMEAGKQFTFIIKPDANDRTITGWDSTWKWQGGVAPTITGTSGSVDIISGVTDGSNAYVTFIKNFS